MSTTKLIAIDPSLTCSGWALFAGLRLREGLGSLIAVGKIKSLPPSVALQARYVDLQDKICSIFGQLELCKNDVLVCEAPTTMRDPRAAFKVEQVRGIFETLARERGLIVPGRINPRSVQSLVMGLRGKQLERSVVKRTASFLVQSLFKQDLESLGFDVSMASLMKHQDIVDAILVGSFAMSRLQHMERGQFTIDDSFLAQPGRVGKRIAR